MSKNRVIKDSKLYISNIDSGVSLPGVWFGSIFVSKTCFKNSDKIRMIFSKLFNGVKWDHRLQYETINMMVQDNANIIEDKIEEWFDTNHEFTKAKYKEILDKYPRFLNRLTDSKYVGKKVEEEVKLVLFNFRDMIIQNNKRLKLKF